MKERILVTGATGFIGRALVKELVNKGFEVFTLYKSDQFEKRIEGVNMIGPIDLTSERSVEEIVNIKPEIIVNLASRTPVRFSYSDPWDYFSTNVRIAINVANATIKANSHLIMHQRLKYILIPIEFISGRKMSYFIQQVHMQSLSRPARQ